MTTSEDDFLKQQKERINKEYQQFLPEPPSIVAAVLTRYADTECGRFLASLLQYSEPFRQLVTAHPDTFRRKLVETEGDPERLEDLMHELAVVALLLASDLFTEVVFEPARKGPDIQTKLGGDTLYFEVTRIGDPPERIAYDGLVRALTKRLESVASPFVVDLAHARPGNEITLADLQKVKPEALCESVERLIAKAADGEHIVKEPVHVLDWTVTVRALPTKVRPGTSLNLGVQPQFVRKNPSQKIADVFRRKYKQGQFTHGHTILVMRNMAEDLDDFRTFDKAMADICEDHGGDPLDRGHRVEFFERYQGLAALLFQHSWPVDGKQNFLAVNYQSDFVLPDQVKIFLETMPLWPR